MLHLYILQAETKLINELVDFKQVYFYCVIHKCISTSRVILHNTIGQFVINVISRVILHNTIGQFAINVISRVIY